MPPSESTNDLLADWDLQAPSCGSIHAGADPVDVAGNWAVLGDTAPYPPLRALDRLPGESLGFLDEFSLGEPESEDSPSPWGSGAGPDGNTIRRQVRPIGPLSLPSLSGRPDLGQGREGPRPRSSRNLPGEGDVIAGFRILQQLGRGAFAHVYLAEEIRLGGRLVAIKVSRAEGDEPRILARLQHANIVPVHSVCDDPETGLRVLCMPFFGGANLAQVLDTTGGLTTTGRTGRSLVEALDRISQGHPPIASEFLRPSSARLRSSDPLGAADTPAIGTPIDLSSPGGNSTVNGSALVLGFRSLISRIVRGGPLYPDRPIGSLPDDDPHRPGLHFLRTATAVQAAAWIVARLAEGLDHAHSRGLLHRDLKPANVLLAADGTPMLLDFNLAAESRPQSPEGEIGRAFLGGTLPYMAPEHLDAFSPQGTTAPHDVDHRADLYALGLILLELLTGEHPFPTPTPPPGMSPSELIRQMIEARRRPPSLRARCPEVPWSLDAVVAMCLEFDPGRRYARARDLAEDLRRFLDDLPMKHAPEPSLRERAAKFSRRHRTLCSSTSISLIALVLACALGAAVVAVYGAMQGLVARFQRQAFERDFVEAQFLLNTADASDRHLRAGLAKAEELLDRLPLEGRAAPAAAWFRSLTADEQRRMRQELFELTILEARARVQLASRRGNESDRLEAIKRGIARLDRVEPVADHAPAALFDERARYHAALGDAALAVRDRRLAALARPSSCHDWTLLGTTRLSSGDPTAAEQALRQALRLDCTSFWAWFMMGHCHFAQGRFVEAAGDFAACTAHGSQFAWAHFNRGLALARAGLLDSARDAYDHAIRIDPAFAEALVNRALVELELNQVEPALADLSLAIKLGRDDVGILAARGEALSRLGLHSEAERQFQRLLAAEPDNAVVRAARGMTRLRTDPRGAHEDFEHVLHNDPRHATANYGMALVVRPEDPKVALKHLDLALDSDPNLVDAIQLRALVRARLGDPATFDDVDRLLKIPTARRYYNAACAVAVYAVQAREPRQFPHAMELLTRAVDLGFPAQEAVSDPDLAPLRERPEFHRLQSRQKSTHDGRG